MIVRRFEERTSPGVRTVLVTGATDGIGRQTALDLAEAGHTVLAHGRVPERLAAVQAESRRKGQRGVQTLCADLASRADSERLAGDVVAAVARLDILIHNAGTYEPDPVRTVDGVERTLAVNHLAGFLLTLRLLGLLVASRAHVVFVSSISHAWSLDEGELDLLEDYDGIEAYERSKLAQLTCAYQLAERLHPRGVRVNALDPGTVDTKLLRAGWRTRGVPVARGARAVCGVALGPVTGGGTGGYYINDRSARSAPVTYDPEVRRRIWEWSEAHIGLRFEEALRAV